MEVNGCRQLSGWFPTFFKISSFVFSRRKKLTQIWNNLRVRKWWQNVHVWVNNPFNAQAIWIFNAGKLYYCRNRV